MEPGDRERQTTGTCEELVQEQKEESEIQKRYKGSQQEIKEEGGAAVEVTVRPLLFVRIWQFRIPSEKADEFRDVYGPDGEWAKLFRRAAGFLGTELLHSATHPNIFLTIDRWDSAEAWAAFLRAWGEDYAALDRRCKSLTVSEGEIGSFRSA
jgi:heme-degrading monooxygenase HmoA